MKKIQIIVLLSVRVIHLEQRLTVLDGELHHHRACPEHIAVHRDVVAEDLGPGRGSPSSLAAHLASRDAPSPSPASTDSPPDSRRSPDI